MALVLLWVAEQRVGERHWLTTGLTYMPQQVFALPGLLLLVWAIARRNRTALLALGVTAAFFTVTFLGLAWARRPAPRDGTVRVMTWNVHHASGGADAIAAVVKEQAPDVLCLQEANSGLGHGRVIPRLAPLLPEYRFVEAEELAIGARLPAVRHRVFPTLRRWRPALLAEYRSGGTTLAVVNVHFATAGGADSVLTGKKGRRSYLRETAAIRQRQSAGIERLAEQVTGPMVVCGDINTPPRGLVYGRLRRVFDDAFASAGRGFGWTYPAKGPVLRIDYVWTLGARTARAWTPSTSASDHRPVVADVALSASR